MNKNKQIISKLCLVLASLIWGFCFAFQEIASTKISAYTFSFARILLAGIVTLPFGIMYSKKEEKQSEKKLNKKDLFLGAGLMGMSMGIAAILQQVGLIYTSAGKSSFVTALYIVIVPFLYVLLKNKVGLKNWVSIFLAVIGLFLLCIKSNFTIGFGDLITLLSALFFAVQIICIDIFSKKVNPILLSSTQFFFASVISLCMALITNSFDIYNLKEVIFPLIYGGVFSGGLAYTLQVIGQRNTKPMIASLLMSLESVFGALGGFLILGEKLSLKELIGCIIIFSAIIICQIDFSFIKKEKENVQ